MLTILKSTQSGVEVIPEPRENCWIHVIDPTPEEVNFLESLKVPNDFILFPLDIDERARMEKDEDVTLIILRIPYFQGGDSDIPYTTMPLGIIFMPTIMVTVCRREHIIIQEFMNGRKRGVSTGKKYRFVLQLLHRTATEYLNCLRDINKQVDIVEDRLQISQKNEEVLQLLKYQKSLVYFTTALKSNELMMAKLQSLRFFHAYPDDEELLGDVLIEIQQAIEMVGIANNILSQMMDAFASIISNNLNVVMKVLALITIVLSLPTLVASVFGMNVEIPFQHSAYAFWITMGLSIMLSVFIIFIFRRNRWF